MIIDLHSHTTASDGTDSPDEILKNAIKKKIKYFAITDHDTIDGIKDLETKNKINFISGVEISAEFKKTLHILGYDFDTKDPELNKTLNELQEFRLNRNKKMLENMQKLGFNITFEELVEVAGSELIGRPHFAMKMVEKGYVKNKQEAFDKFLAKGKPLYMNKKRLEPKKAIELILNAGGLPVMAHPFQTKLVGNELIELMNELVSNGLKGIEALYSEHSKEQTEFLIDYAKKNNLFITAGSDYHGSNKNIHLGMKIDSKQFDKFLDMRKNNDQK